MKITNISLAIIAHAAASEGKNLFGGEVVTRDNGNINGNGNGNGDGNGKGSMKAERRKKVINYWMGNNKANMKNARPRDLGVEAPVDEDKGKGKGKGGNLKGTGKKRGLQTLVDEAPWTNGGEILQAAGRLMFRIGPYGYVCSATAVTDEDTPNRSIIVTAAHCVHDETAFATDFLFIPNQDDGGTDGSDTNCSNDDVFGCWTPSFAVVDNGWLANSPFPGNIPDDYAYLVVDDIDSHQGGPAGVPDALDQAVPAMDISWQAPVLGSPSYALGYSYSKDPDFRYCVQNLEARGAGYEGYLLSGCGMSGGASGGPWIQTLDANGRGEIISVNSYGPMYPPPHYMGGPRLVDNSARCLYEFAKTVDESSAAGGGIVVTCDDYNDCSTCEFSDGNGDGPTAAPVPTSAPTPCVDGEEITVAVRTDNYPGETSWDLTNQCTGQIEKSAGTESYGSANTQYSDTYCVPSAQYKFEIRDTFGDGLCCSWGQGGYEVVLGGVTVASGGDFAEGESTTFGACTTPTPDPTPSGTTAPPTTAAPTTASPTTASPTTAAPTTASPTTAAPTTSSPTTAAPVSSFPQPTTPPPTAGSSTSPAPTADPLPTPPPSPCEGAQVTVAVRTDNFAFETSWELFNECTGQVEASMGSGSYQSANTQHSNTYCVPSAQYRFEIKDTYGDGICCSWGQGDYEVLMDGATVASGGQFASAESTSFGSCGPTTPPPTTVAPTTSAPTTAAPTTAAPTTAVPEPTTPPPVTPAPTPAPTPLSSQGPVATFNPTLNVPSCDAVGPSCSSGPLLLNGRGNFENDQPNTLDGCADGTYGSYHSDESIDAITITALGGGQLQEGAVVRVDALVYPYSTGQYDTADFYFAADANAPEWFFIDSVAPSSGGLQTLSVEYMLPQGDVQAVRVNFRFFGSPVSCSEGNWDDTDDLVFKVGAGSGVATTYAKPAPVAKLSQTLPVCADFRDEGRCVSAAYNGELVCKWDGDGRGCYES